MSIYKDIIETEVSDAETQIVILSMFHFHYNSNMNDKILDKIYNQYNNNTISDWLCMVNYNEKSDQSLIVWNNLYTHPC